MMDSTKSACKRVRTRQEWFTDGCPGIERVLDTLQEGEDTPGVVHYREIYMSKRLVEDLQEGEDTPGVVHWSSCSV